MHLIIFSSIFVEFCEDEIFLESLIADEFPKILVFLGTSDLLKRLYVCVVWQKEKCFSVV